MISSAISNFIASFSRPIGGKGPTTRVLNSEIDNAAPALTHRQKMEAISVVPPTSVLKS